MKIILATLITTLAAYAQACCAQEVTMSVFSQQQTFNEFQQQTVQPSWLIGNKGELQLMGFTQITRTQQQLDSSQSVEQLLGFGVHQQITPFLYTQVVVTEQDGGQSAVKVGVEF
ncbi:MAG: hypothetical protein JXR16_13730 [Bermanella sp.]